MKYIIFTKSDLSNYKNEHIIKGTLNDTPLAALINLCTY